MRNLSEHRPRVEIKGNDITVTEHQYSILRRTKEVLELNDFDCVIMGIESDSKFKTAV
jgi:hypothetical protein